MNVNIEKRKLEFEKAHRYIKRCLENGKTLSGLLLENQDLKLGVIETYIPCNASENSSLNFEFGGTISASESTVVEEFKDSFGIEPIYNTDRYLVEEIYDFLTPNKFGVCVFEDESAEASDPFLKNLSTDVRYFGDEVYHFINSDMPDKVKIKKTISVSRSWLFVGVLTFFEPKSFDLTSANISKEDIRKFAEQAKHIIVGAYDKEGFLIWSKK